MQGKLSEDVSETPPPPFKRGVSYYFVLIFFVGPIWSIVPASWAFVLYALTNRAKALTSTNYKILFVLALCEV